MKNRFGHDIKRGMDVLVTAPNGPRYAGKVYSVLPMDTFSRAYGRQVRLDSADGVIVNIDDVAPAMKPNPAKKKKPRTAAQKAATARMLAANAARPKHVRTAAQKKARKAANNVPGYYPNPNPKRKKSAYEEKYEKTMYAVHWATQPKHIYLGVFSKLSDAKEVAQDLADRHNRAIKVSTISNLAL